MVPVSLVPDSLGAVAPLVPRGAPASPGAVIASAPVPDGVVAEDPVSAPDGDGVPVSVDGGVPVSVDGGVPDGAGGAPVSVEVPDGGVPVVPGIPEVPGGGVPVVPGMSEVPAGGVPVVPGVPELPGGVPVVPGVLGVDCDVSVVPGVLGVDVSVVPEGAMPGGGVSRPDVVVVPGGMVVVPGAVGIVLGAVAGPPGESSLVIRPVDRPRSVPSTGLGLPGTPPGFSSVLRLQAPAPTASTIENRIAPRRMELPPTLPAATCVRASTG